MFIGLEDATVMSWCWGCGGVGCERDCAVGCEWESKCDDVVVFVSVFFVLVGVVAVAVGDGDEDEDDGGSPEMGGIS